MPKHPKVKFRINQKLDIDIATEFLDVQGGGIDFGNHIVELYPELSKAKSLSGNTRKNEVRKFTKIYYQQRKSDLEKKAHQFSNAWRVAEADFFRGTMKVFGSYPWPNGKYVCYLSIYDCNPRFLEDKTFQVYFHHSQGSNHLVAHEMLHFIFFDYLYKQEKSFKEKLNENTIWLMAEYFNDQILALPEFKKFKSKDSRSYPHVADFAKKFNNLSEEKMNITSFFNQVKTIL